MMEYEQVEQPLPPVQGYAPPMHQANGNMVLMTNPEEEIDKLEANFRGETVKADGTTKKEFEARMNELGINKIVGMVRALVNRDTIMSNLDDKVLFNLLDFLADTLVKVLMTNRRAFSILSDSDRDAIFFQSMAVSHITMLRGYKEGDKRFWKGSTHEVSYGNQPQERKGWLDKISPKGW